MKAYFISLTKLLGFLLLAFSSVLLAQNKDVSLANIGFNQTPHSNMSLSNGLQITFIPFGYLPLTTARLVSKHTQLSASQHQALSSFYADIFNKMKKEGVFYGVEAHYQVNNSHSYLELSGLSTEIEKAILHIGNAFIVDKAASSNITTSRFNDNVGVVESLTNKASLHLRAELNLLPGQARKQANKTDLAVAKKQANNPLDKLLLPNDSHWYIVGEFDEQNVAEKITQTFSRWPLAQRIKASTIDILQDKVHIKFIDKQGELSAFSLGIIVNENIEQNEQRELISLALLRQLLNDEITQRLADQNVTFELSHLEHQDQLMLFFDFQAPTTQVSDVLTLFHSSLTSLTNNAINNDNLSVAITKLAGNFASKQESPEGMITLFQHLWLQNLPSDSLKYYVSQAQDINRQDIVLLSEKLINSEFWFLRIIGNEQILVPQLKEVSALKRFW